MRVSLKSNDYNSLETILVDDCPFRQQWVVTSQSVLYTHPHRPSKLHLDIKLSDTQSTITTSIIDAVRALHPDLAMIDDRVDGVLKGVLIPTRYGHVDISFKTRDGGRLLAEHVVPDVDLSVLLSPTHVWKTRHTCGILWTVFDVVANVTYET
jgi:hypothetical protein